MSTYKPGDFTSPSMGEEKNNLKLTVVIPVYNEKSTIMTALRRVQEVSLNKEIIIVDNCSTDGTRELLQEVDSDVRVIYQPRNMGKGTSIRTAIPYSSGDYLVIQDADLEYNPQDYHRALEEALKKGSDAVYGSRVLGGRNTLYLRYYLGVRFLTFCTNLLFGSRLTDVATAFKMIKTSVLKKLTLSSSGFDLDFELTNKLCKGGWRIDEILVSYAPRSFVQGKKIRAKDGLKALYVIIRDWLEG